MNEDLIHEYDVAIAELEKLGMGKEVLDAYYRRRDKLIKDSSQLPFETNK